MKNIDICFAADDAYAPFMGVAIQSILEAKKKEEFIRFHILDVGISQTNRQKLLSLQSLYSHFSLAFYPLDQEILACAPIENSHLSRAAYARLFLDKGLPADVKRLIYLDCDVFVRGSLAELAEVDLSGCLLGGVEDLGVMRMARKGRHPWPFEKSVYINTGVLVVDIPRWRAAKAGDMIWQYVRRPKYPLLFEDQDAINFSLYGKIKILSPRWNGQMYWGNSACDKEPNISWLRTQLQTCPIVHFATPSKPWKYGGGVHGNVRQYQQLMRRSPWSDAKQSLRLGSLCRKIGRYWLIHPLCFLQPKFYRNLYWEGLAVFR